MPATLPFDVNLRAEGTTFYMYPSRMLAQACTVLTYEQAALITPEFVKQVQRICAHMGGYAVAAPQIGILSRFFVLYPHKDLPDDAPDIWLDPRIVQVSEETVCRKEGCLSIPAARGKDRFAMLSRPAWVHVEYMNLEGQIKRIHCEGMLARVVQHEIDHLDGILFKDRCSPIATDKLRLVLHALRAQEPTYVIPPDDGRPWTYRLNHSNGDHGTSDK